SCSRKCRTKSPTTSSPTAVKSAERRPSRRVPTLMLVGHPPTYAAKLLISTNGTPTSFEYRSIDDRPIVSTSYVSEATGQAPASVSASTDGAASGRENQRTASTLFSVKKRTPSLPIACRSPKNEPLMPL